jgi:predicted ferric reductase
MKKIFAWGFLLANIAIIAWFWMQTSTVSVIGLGRLAGLLLEFFLLVQLVLIGRMSWIEQVFGHDGLNLLHRWIGYGLVLLLVAHPLLLSIGEGPFRDLVFGWPDVFNAFIGAMLLVGVIILSVPWIRRRLHYESWYFAHLATYAAIMLAFGHQQTGGDFVNRSFVVYWNVLNFGVFGLYFLSRFLWPFWLFARHRFVVQRVVRESPDAWSVYVTGKHMERFRFRGGQFANIVFFARGLWAPHPFSFSHGYNGRFLRFTIKSLGDATNAVAQLKPGTHVLVDGPLGVFTADRAVTNKYLLISGGIGVTPIRAMAGELAARNADVVVLYSARSEAHTALLPELRTKTPHVHVFIGERITADRIVRAVPDASERDAFICGPTPMMDAMSDALREIGVPRSQIHAERFGY